MNQKIMKCGHSPNATTIDGKPCCAICAPKAEAYEIDERNIDLTGREAKCLYCGTYMNSDFNLPFFEYKPDSEGDSFYCGCYGWD